MADDRPVLVLTGLDDPTAEPVVAELYARGVPVVRFDAADFPGGLSFAARFGSDTSGMDGWLRTRSRTALLSSVRSLYYRRPTMFSFPHMEPRDRGFAVLQARYGLGGALASLPGCLYVNHPHRIADADYKPTQLKAAVEIGFMVPPTVITDSLDVVRAFAAEVGRFVYKPLRAVPYTKDGEPVAVWVEEVNPDDLNDEIKHSAHLFQAKVDKVADLRVTVVGNEVFAVRIDGEYLDFRYDYDTLKYAPVDVPDTPRRLLHAYLHRFGLAFGAFDFALGHEGEWYFLECNANGQWGFVEDATGLPLTAAVADLLQRGRDGVA